MLQLSALPTHHLDLVCDVAYDYYGERIATASADQRIKVWKKNSEGRWELQADWKAHDSPILKVAWSHPEHGNLIASCSYDRTVKVWEESGLDHRPSSSTTSSTMKKWTEKAYLVDAKGSVRTVEFAPTQFGLKLASISTDNLLRIYTSLSPTLNDWQPTTTVPIPTLSLPDLPTSGDQPPATSGLGSGLLANPSVSMLGSTSSISSGKNNEAFGGWDLSFCKEGWWGLLIAVGCGSSGVVKIVNLSSATPQALLILSPPAPGSNLTASNPSNSSNSTPSHPNPFAANSSFASTIQSAPSSSSSNLGTQTVTTLSWAPSCGRSYHLLATGSKDGSVRVWKMRPPVESEVDGMEVDEGQGDGGKWTSEIAGEWGKGEASIGKVDWNVTGTILTTASEDGKINLYKATYGGEWNLMGSFTAEAPSAGGDDAME